MKSSTPELLKFQKLMRRLRESRRGTIGLLEGMWLAVGKNCPRGDIGKFSNEEIAIMVDWEGDPDELISALVECRWLDVCDTHRLVVHDWHDHCPTYIKGGLVKKGEDIAIATSYEVQAKVQAKVPPEPQSGTTLGGSYEVPSTKPSLVKPSLVKSSLSNSSELLQASEPVDSALVFELVGKDSGPWSPPLSLIDQFEKWYPSMDVDSELRKAAAWHATNPTKRKTKSGITKFLNAWLTKANDRGGINGANNQPPKQLTLSERLASIRMEDYQQ